MAAAGGAAEPAAALAQGNAETAKSIYEFSAVDLDGAAHSLSEWKGKVMIIMNVASA